VPKPTYIAIEGPIGAGKTSLAKMLSSDLQARLVLEAPEENPFLGPFYKDPERYALATQLHFMEARYRQQVGLAEGQEALITDYSFIKDWIFARLNLDGDELTLYQRIHSHFLEKMRQPDLIIYLQSDPGQLRKHVKQRKVAYEKHITLDYLEEVLESYNQFFFDYDQTPLLVVNCSQIDFVNNPDHYQSLIHEIFNEKREKKHYVSIGG
jgi:deoxyguanosine kinase